MCHHLCGLLSGNVGSCWALAVLTHLSYVTKQCQILWPIMTQKYKTRQKWILEATWVDCLEAVHGLSRYSAPTYCVPGTVLVLKNLCFAFLQSQYFHPYFQIAPVTQLGKV
jgi:hypothetical protein